MSQAESIRFALGILSLVAVALGSAALGSLHLGRDIVVVVVRAIVQLLLVASVIAVLFRTAWLAPFYLVAMTAVAAATSARRVRGRVAGRVYVPAIVAIAAGAYPVAVLVLATGALPADVRQLLPFTAQVIGGAMTATTLAALRMVDDTGQRWDEVEAWLSLGATPATAVAPVGRSAASAALVPALDQTRNVGLVVLPGAFVGLLLAGATPLEAGRVQLLVLVGLLAAETVAAVVVTRLLGSTVGWRQPLPR